MPDIRLRNAISQTDLILLVDDDLAPDHPEKLTPLLRQLTVERNSAGRQCYSGLARAGGGRAGASGRVKEAVRRIGGLLRNGYSALQSIPEEEGLEAEIAGALVTYGWEGGNLGEMNWPARIIRLAYQALEVTPQLPAAVRYPANVITRLTTWIGVHEASKMIADGGEIRVLVDAETKLIASLEAITSRVRHFLCSASDRVEYNPGLARRGFQVKRMPGDAKEQPKPDAPGPATFNAGTQELSIPALPAHTSELVSFRRAAGGEEEQGGVSLTNVVSVSAFSPLEPGVTYTFSCSGRNSRGFGPRSNEISFTA